MCHRLSLILLFLFTSAALALQDSWPTLQESLANPAAPTHSIALPDECHISDIVWSDDSSRVYVSMTVNAVDLWPWLVFHWPEITASLLSLILFIALAWVARRWWKRRYISAVGEPHCARCSYQLTGRADAQNCPECGRSLTGRGVTFGRPRRKWPIIVTALLLTMTTSAYFLGRNHVPRTGRVAYWQHWPSARFYTWATNRNHWSVTRFPTKVFRLVEINPVTGKLVRIIFTKPKYDPNAINWGWRMLPGTSADRILISARTGVYEIDTTDGSIVQKFELPQSLTDFIFWLRDIALHPSKPLLYALIGQSKVVSWDLNTGEMSEVLDLPDRGNSYMYALFPLPDADTVILRWSLNRSATESGFEFIDLNTLETVVSQREPKHDLSQTIGTSENEILYSWTEYRGVEGQNVTEQTIIRWSPGMSTPEELLTLPLRRIGTIINGQQSNRLYFTGFPVASGRQLPISGRQLPIVAVFDRDNNSWLRPLQTPRFHDTRVTVSPDERWAITTYPEATRDPSIFIFDLNTIHGKPADGHSGP